MRLYIVAFFVFTASLRCVAEDAALQTVRGTRIACEIDVPATWSVLGTNESVIAVHGDGMEPRVVTIAGRDWLEFTVIATVDKESTTFLNYTYAGRIGNFTIIGQVPTADLEEKRDLLTRYMKSFRFPKLAGSPPKNGH